VMQAFTLSQRAIRDLDGIRDFTIETWGVEQAQKYVTDIRLEIQKQAINPSLRRPCDDIRKGYFRANSHAIFFRPSVHGIRVIRILHQSMDFKRRV
jgi:toxin ParE1/3/4